MKKSAAGIVAVIAVIAGVLVAEQSGAFSIRELLGLDPEEQPGAAQAAETSPATDSGNWAQPSGAAPAGIELVDIEKIVANLDGAQRQALLAEQEGFRRFVQQEADNLSVLSAAHANKVQDDTNVQYLMQRAAESVLREAYLARLIAGKIPADFPTEAQTREYFDKNKDKFAIGERVYVWQIYLPLGDSKDPKARQKQAEEIVRELNAGKGDFAAAAWKYSEHEVSRRSGGFMGLMKIADIKPQLRDPLLALPEGKISNPITAEDGVHIVKRGARVPPEQMAFEDIEDQIRKRLIDQARTQLRKAIYEQARKSYPMTLPESKIEEWRLRLRTNVPAASGDAPKKP